MTYEIKVEAHGVIEHHKLWAPTEEIALDEFGNTPNEVVLEISELGP